MNSVWEDGEKKEAGEIILGFKKIKKQKPHNLRSFLTQSVIKLPKRKTREAGQWALVLPPRAR